MAVSLNAVPRKLVQDIPPPGLVGISYPETVALVETMAAQDARIIFDTMRPLGDEFWNLIDGRRSISDIAESLCIQFDLELDLELFLPIAEGLIKTDFITTGRNTRLTEWARNARFSFES